MNVFCNEKAVELFIGDGDKIGRNRVFIKNETTNYF